jgi:hypothetical protein
MAGLIAALLTELLTGFYELPVPHAQVGQLLAAKGQLYKGVEYMLRAFELEPIGQVGLCPPSIAATLLGPLAPPMVVTLSSAR